MEQEIIDIKQESTQVAEEFGANGTDVSHWAKGLLCQTANLTGTLAGFKAATKLVDQGFSLQQTGILIGCTGLVIAGCLYGSRISKLYQ